MDRFPSDADGDVLKSLASKGFDFDTPTDVEFYCYAEDTAKAAGIAKMMQDVGFEADIYEDDRVSVYFKKQMILTYDSVVDEQKIANQRLSAFQSECDGWMVGFVPDGANRKEAT